MSRSALRPPPPRLRRQRPELRRFLAAGLVCLAVAVALHAAAPTAPPTEPVLVAARDLPAGHRLDRADLTMAAWAPGSGPVDRLTRTDDAVGRLSAGPLRRGSSITDAELLGPGLLTGQATDLVAVPVQVVGGGLAGLVGRGDRIDVIAAATSSTVVSAAVVLADPAQPSSADGLGLGAADATATGASGLSAGSAGQSVILGVPLEAAQALAHAEAVGPLTIAVHPR